MSAETGEILVTYMALLVFIMGHLSAVPVCYITVIVVVQKLVLKGCASTKQVDISQRDAGT